MTEKSVVKYSKPFFHEIAALNSTETPEFQADYNYTPLEVAGLLCFLVGVIQVNIFDNLPKQFETIYFYLQLLMYVFRLGIVASILSDCLVSGLITGAAVHIFTAQVKDFFGVEIPPVGAYFKIIRVRSFSNSCAGIVFDLHHIAE